MYDYRGRRQPLVVFAFIIERDKSFSIDMDLHRMLKREERRDRGRTEIMEGPNHGNTVGLRE